MRVSILGILALACTLLGGGSDAFAGEARYTVVPIHPPEGADFRNGVGFGINDSGQIVGNYILFVDPSNYVYRGRAYVHADVSGTVELAWPEAWVSDAVGINNAGQIALHGGESGSQLEAYRYTPGVGYEPLGNFGGTVTEAEAINSAGQITGYSRRADGREDAFRYNDGAGMENLGSSFMIGSRGFAINDQGWVAGYGDGNAIVWDDQGILDLGPGRAYGINNRGTAVGLVFAPWRAYEAFVYRDGQMNFLYQLGAGSALVDINNADVAVGSGLVNGPHQHALLWNQAEGLTDLNTVLAENSGWTLVSGAAINDLGQITGQGVVNGGGMAYRLDPIPPKLSIQRSPTNMTVSWSPAWPGLVLESTDDLWAPLWQPVETGGTNVVIVPASGPRRFFRLNLEGARGLCWGP